MGGGILKAQGGFKFQLVATEEVILLIWKILEWYLVKEKHELPLRLIAWLYMQIILQNILFKIKLVNF
jgi:hypothetical protein